MVAVTHFCSSPITWRRLRDLTCRQPESGVPGKAPPRGGVDRMFDGDGKIAGMKAYWSAANITQL